MPDASDVDEGDDHRHGPSPPVGDPLLGDVGVSSGKHLVSNRQAAGVVGITIFVAAIWIVTTGGAFDRSTPAVPGGSETGPAQSSTNKGVTLLLEARSDGRCCFVTSVNPGDASTRALCFVEVFDEADRLQSTTLVPRSRRAIAAAAASKCGSVDRSTGFKRSPWTSRTSTISRSAVRRRGTGVPRSELEHRLDMGAG